MNETVHIDNETLVDYLYGEAHEDERDRVERHLQQCGICGGQFAALTDVRTALATWTPPGVDQGFGVLRSSARPTQTVAVDAAPWWHTVPVWAQAVAAVLVLAVSAGVANIQIRSNADGLVVTTGWLSPAAAPAAATAGEPAVSSADWQVALSTLEADLRNELRLGRAPVAAPVAARSTSDDAILGRVQALLTASETRQQRELALRLTQHQRDLDIQRRADLVRLEQGFGQFEGRTVAEQARQRQMLNYVMRVSGKPQQ